MFIIPVNECGQIIPSREEDLVVPSVAEPTRQLSQVTTLLSEWTKQKQLIGSPLKYSNTSLFLPQSDLVASIVFCTSRNLLITFHPFLSVIQILKQGAFQRLLYN